MGGRRGAHVYGANARSYVTMGQVADANPNCLVAKAPNARPFLQTNEQCGTAIVPGEPRTPPGFLPRCLVVLLAVESRKALFDQMMSEGRVLADPLLIEVNYTVALDPDPELNATAASCALSRIVADNYARDRVLQEEQDALVAARADHAKTVKLLEWWERTVETLPAFQPPGPPPPPPPSPPPFKAATSPSYPPGPPLAPIALSYDARIAAISETADRKLQVVQDLEAKVSGCVSSRDVTCGRSSAEAPDPWLAEDGRPCRGNATKETREEDYCGFWASTLNLDAADSEEFEDLYEAGPHCIAEDGVTVLRCAPTADRTARSGVYELQEWYKPDRRYCAWEFFRERETSSPTAKIDEQACLAEQVERNRTCQLEQCSQCTSQCTYPVVEAAVGVVACTFEHDVVGQQYCAHSSDMGQWMRAHHGAIRRDGYPAVPEKLFAESYEICTWNEKGRVARDGLSCRKEHRESPIGQFQPGFDTDGNPVRRRGYIVTCAKDSDCLPGALPHPSVERRALLLPEKVCTLRLQHDRVQGRGHRRRHQLP